MSKERLTPEELRNIDEGTYIVLELDESVYWQGDEGRVKSVNKRDNGTVIITYKESLHTLKIPRDARKGMTSDGTARGADNLPVKKVYKRTKLF